MQRQYTLRLSQGAGVYDPLEVVLLESERVVKLALCASQITQKLQAILITTIAEALVIWQEDHGEFPPDGRG